MNIEGDLLPMIMTSFLSIPLIFIHIEDFKHLKDIEKVHSQTGINYL
jgi:hypothetical protein